MVDSSSRVVIGKEYVVLSGNPANAQFNIPATANPTIVELAPPPITDNSSNLDGNSAAYQATIANGSGVSGTDFTFSTFGVVSATTANEINGTFAGPVGLVNPSAAGKYFYMDLSYQVPGTTVPATYLGSIEVDVLAYGSTLPGTVVTGGLQTAGRETLPNVSLYISDVLHSLPQVVGASASPPPPPVVTSPPPPVVTSPPPPPVVVSPPPPPAPVVKNLGVDFSSSYYLSKYSDVAAAGVDPGTHYDFFGWHEGRNPSLAFNTNYYLSQNPDVKAAGIDPLVHFETFGWKEGRNPNAYFNVNFYLSKNPDVKAAGVDPLWHYETYGWKEGRDAGTGVTGGFDTLKYLADNPDVKAAGVNPLDHYLAFGMFEGRSFA